MIIHKRERSGALASLTAVILLVGGCAVHSRPAGPPKSPTVGQSHDCTPLSERYKGHYPVRIVGSTVDSSYKTKQASSVQAEALRTIQGLHKIGATTVGEVALYTNPQNLPDYQAADALDTPLPGPYSQIAEDVANTLLKKAHDSGVPDEAVRITSGVTAITPTPIAGDQPQASNSGIQISIHYTFCKRQR
jgi:hypothetical protein